MKKKSQVTMLMIMAIAIFIVVSLVLYLSKSAIKKQTNLATKKSQGTSLDTQAISEFASSCLDKTTKDAVRLLGKQGGYIYSSQGGTLLDYSDVQLGHLYVDYANNKVSYNILPPAFKVAEYSADIPQYPWSTFPNSLEDPSKQTFEGYFGMSNLPPLLPKDGPHSIQYQIESYINNNIGNCLDFSAFENQGYEITINNTNATVTIGENDVFSKISVDMRITNKQTLDSTKINQFSSDTNIRLKQIYLFAKSLIDNEIKDISFNISSPENSKGDMKVTVIRDVFSKDDIIILSDTKSFLNAKPYEYIFARKNRAPALYYINSGDKEFDQGYTINKMEELTTTEPSAQDPDEDQVTITTDPLIPYNVQTTFLYPIKIIASDGVLSDYQTIGVKAKQ